jgi:DNA-binding transcriptional MerR regulator
MIKIGDFSRICQLSVKTLRYYAEIGLLEPVQTDPFTGYRFYAIEQLQQVNRILALKDLGFTLEEIAMTLNQNMTAEQLRGILRMKQAEIHVRLQADQERLARVEARLQLIEQEDNMPTYDVVLKKVEPIHVASTRAIIPSYPEQGGLWKTLGGALASLRVQPVGPCFTIYHSDEPEIDAEVCEPLAAPIQVSGPITSYTLPEVEVASTVHHGPFVTISEAYAALIQWINSNNYRISGPGREMVHGRGGIKN